MASKIKSREQVTKIKEQVVKSKERKKISLNFAHCSLFIAHCMLLIAHLYCSFELYAQDSGYFLDTSGNEPRFIQRISWDGGEYALRYEVVIERETADGYRELLREFTAAQFIELSLLQGKYRCYVIPYDYLDQSGARSDWMYIEVLAALYPELDDTLLEFVYSEMGLRSTDQRYEDTVYEMNFSGRNLVPGADIELRDSDGARIVPFAIYINENGTGARLSFYKDQLLPGNYELFVRNPGGLEANRELTVVVREAVVPELTEQPELADEIDGTQAVRSEQVQSEQVQLAEYQKTTQLFLSAAWMPSVTIYDRGNRLFDEWWSPIGAGIRLGIVATIPGIINLGAELTEAWSVLYDGSDGRATHIDSTVNFLMQKRSPGEKTAVAFRLGIGFSLPLFSDNEYSTPFTDLLYTNIGVSLLFFVWNDMYLESGIDYAHWFSGRFSGNFRPWFGIGLRF
jgi:hypothetical protein